MDFYTIGMKEIERGPNKGEFEIYPDFTVGRSKDLMVRGRSFYAIWDGVTGLWSTDEYDVQRLVDEEMTLYAQKMKVDTGVAPHVKYLRSFGSNGWSQFRKYMQNISDNSHQLDTRLTFANTEVKKSDYVSRRLSYPLAAGDYSSWDELVGTLYSVEERMKIEWAIGAIVSGDSTSIHKFVVFYGPPASGKSTVLNIIQKLFEGYTTSFDAKAIGGNANTFSTEVFKDNPLVAIQHDGDLSKIEDNAKLNSIVSHEPMSINEKFKPAHTSSINAFLLMGTNQPVRISDAKSGLIRRLIDIHPTGVKIPTNHYFTLMAQMDFELGAIANHCLEVYRHLGKNHYNGYRPLEMMLQTDVFFNFIEAHFDIFKSQDGTSLRQAYLLYKEYCSDSGIERPIPSYKVREELRNYFDEFKDRGVINGETVRSCYMGFNANKFKAPAKDEPAFSLVMEEEVSLLDDLLASYPAQLSKIDEFGSESPAQRWANVTTTLADIDTSELHFVKVPENHIVIDFDLKDENDRKSLERNLRAASEWPATYAELSKSGGGVHLHYIYTGGVVSGLRQDYSDGIEVKTFTGNASLRRRLARCNAVSVAELNSGLPLKEKKPMLPAQTVQSEKGLRDLIARNLRKEIHPGTKSSIDFIAKILDEAWESGMSYDVSDLRPRIIAFANNSTNQPMQALKTAQHMKYEGQGVAEPVVVQAKDDREVFFDVEVYPNLFVICWKYRGVEKEHVVRMINPTPLQVQELLAFKLVGFYNRRYDNHIMYARIMGYSNEQLFQLSQKLILEKNAGAMFGEAYGLSYTDVWDFSTVKQSLKKFGIDMGMHHMEMDIPWDQPVPPELVDAVVDYCVNDVLITEAAFERQIQDFVARQILAELSGLTVNDTTPKHTAKIIFGDDRNPQNSFKYTDLSKQFPGYEFDLGKSTYRDEDPGEGGYVYAEPGIYNNVALLDITSMHPTSIRLLDLFGKYTPKFNDLVDARIAIKNGRYAEARKMLGGKLAPYLEHESDAKALSFALKIVINIVYGLTSAKFDNPFRDNRNKDNIVAKRGALFMIDLKHAVQDQGFTVAHIKTDSIKIPDATSEIIEFVMDFGAMHGYTFELETVYKKMCLVNDAVYIAQDSDCLAGEKWHAVGAQFQHPYVFKKLFSKDDITWDDLCETKQVTQGSMYLDFDSVHKMMFDRPQGMVFVGRTGRFVPVTEESGGGLLLRVKDDKTYAVTGTKNYFWMEASIAQAMGDKVEVDQNYYERLVDEAIKTINKFGDFESFVN